MQKSGRLRAEMIPISDAKHIRDEWIGLARSAIEPNPYYEIDHLTAVCRHLTPAEAQRLVLVWADAESGRRLAGLFPVSVRGLRHGFPRPVTNLIFDSLVGFCVPLIDDREPDAVWASFLQFVAAETDLPDIVHITEFYADGPCGKALDQVVQAGQACRKAESEFKRAIAHADIGYGEYCARWSRKKARNLRSRTQKLAEMGEISLEIITGDDPRFAETFEEILALEAAGWKGRQGTALASRDNTRAFARSAYFSADAAPMVHLAALRLNGRLVAGDLNLIAQERAYFIRSAYDETFSNLGPGVILYAWLLEQTLDRRRYARLDSCADAGHSLEEVWLESEKVQRLFVTGSARCGAADLERLIVWRGRLRRVRESARRALGLFRRTSAG